MKIKHTSQSSIYARKSLTDQYYKGNLNHIYHYCLFILQNLCFFYNMSNCSRENMPSPEMLAKATGKSLVIILHGWHFVFPLMGDAK